MVKVMVKGVVRNMSEEAFKFAERFFGAVKMEAKNIEAPIPILEPPKLIEPKGESPVIITPRAKPKEPKAIKKVNIIKTPPKATKDVAVKKQKDGKGTVPDK